MKRALALLTVLALAAVPGVDGCRNPTYVNVHITTDVPCERVQGVSITTGTLGALETKIPATRATTCNGGEIGTISLVPTAGDEDELGVRVVMGIGRDVESCTAPAYGDGCVVARRGLHYLSHQALTLPIPLRQICNGVPCGPYETCIKGVCKSAKIEDPAKCTTPDGCNEDTFVNVIGDGGTTSTTPPIATQMKEWCGTATNVDLAAPHAMPGGCPTLAGRSPLLGPTALPVSQDVESKVWANIALSVTDIGYGQRFETQTLSSFDAINLSTGSVLGTRSPTSQYGGCALLDGGGALCIGWGKITTLDTAGVRTESTFVPPDGNAGSTPAPDVWNIGFQNTVFVVGPTTAGGYETRAYEMNGTFKWAYPLGNVAARVRPPLATSADYVYLATDTAVTALNPDTGEFKWSQPGNAIALVTNARRATVYAVLRSGLTSFKLQTYALSGQLGGGTDLAQTDASSAPWSVALLANDDIVLMREGRIEVVSQTGTVRWRKDDPLITAQPLIVDANERIYTVLGDQISAVEASTGNILWQVKPQGNPIVSDLAIGTSGSLYYANDKLRRLR